MPLVIDTNVVAVANRLAGQASLECEAACARTLLDAEQNEVVCVDDGHRILREYGGSANEDGEPGIGDHFYLWLLRNLRNSAHCELVAITQVIGSADGCDFVEFPIDPALAKFDRSDRKFVSVCCTSALNPTILNAVDSDWWHYQEALAANGVLIAFLCGEPPRKGSHPSST